MTKILELIDNMRSNLLEITENLTVEQINTIPNGFNNNIVWNMGHILVVTDELLYKNSPFSIPSYDFDISRFKKGTRPDNVVDEKDISLIREALSDTVPRIRKLLNVYAIETQNNESELLEKLGNDRSIQFTVFHEDMHISTILRQLKILN
jgi:hypothetical protein